VAVPEVPEPCHCSVMSWVEGNPVTDDNPVESYRLLGKINAKFHRQAKNWEIPEGFKRQVWDENGICGDKPLWGNFRDLAALDKEQLELLNQAREVMLKRLEQYGKGQERFGLIHADLMSENIILQDNTPCIIDFDDSGFGWFMYDLATLMTFNVADDNL
jgi:Ser/Thr protein kinase RdoA (MazF antagonist)